MSEHLVKIGTSHHEVVQGRALVDGIGRDIYEGRTLVNNIGYHINFGIPLRKFPVGHTINVNIAGKSTEFIIVHQGNPDPTIYDSSCNDTWLLMKGVYTARPHPWDTDNADYSVSDVHKYLNEEFIYLFDSKLRSVIKEVKIPYARQCTREDNGNWPENDATSVYLGSQGMSAKVFLLSGPEVNWTQYNTGSYGFFNYEGACLDYFKGTAEVDERRSYIPHPDPKYSERGTLACWWLRSKIRSYFDYQLCVWFVLGPGNHEGKGTINGTMVEEEKGVWLRPAMILPGDLRVNQNTNTLRI